MRMWIKQALAVCLAAALATPVLAGDVPDWHAQLTWQGHTARMTAQADGAFVLAAPGATRTIAPQRWRAHTASDLFDGLFAMAQAELQQDAVTAIHDGAFDHGRSIACHCLVAGAKWPFVWTRDLSFATDLDAWRFEPERVRHSLLFKLSAARGKDVPAGRYIMQDTGSGGSWPISTDRVVWFLGARHLLGDKAFADTVYTALTDTLRQDRRYVFDRATGLYRGETSFLDWRQQSYPAWTADNVVFIAQSFALSTNVLHYQALQLAARMAGKQHDPSAATRYARQAAALKQAINARFWRADKGLYMSYIGGRIHPAPFDAYDLLGTDLAILSGVADPARAREALANYPTTAAGSPVIWPQRADQPVYHNRAVWPFVSQYTLRAARRVDDPARIAHELVSQLRAAALNASNMENFPLDAPWLGAVGKAGQPQVDSPRQLWSVAGYLGMVTEGVFGLTADGKVRPKLPASMVPMLFGRRDTITLDTGARTITLRRPVKLSGNLLVAGAVTTHGTHTTVQLVGRQVAAPPLRMDGAAVLPATPAAPRVTVDGRQWRVAVAAPATLYVNGRRHGAITGTRVVPRRDALTCFSITVTGQQGLASLHSPETCVGPQDHVAGSWPRQWQAPRTGTFAAWLRYDNDHGPINTGITAAVKRLRITCGKAPAQVRPLVMPQSDGQQDSTVVRFAAHAGERCTFALAQGFNMSNLAAFAHYTGGAGGASGVLNEAAIGALVIAPLAGSK
ncbi:MAG TPA: Six-hairpin glycosidase-like protein [Rhodanobacteraceae bacterium]